MIVVGTDGGSVYVYGDGFQFVRPWLTEDPIEVISILPLYPNRIIVAFGNNSLVLMELPSLEVIDLLNSDWLSPKYGDLTALHCDTPSEKNFVYVGTSQGVLIVIDILETSIRICDYQLKLSDFGLSDQSLSISDIQSCPKDEKFIAVGFDGDFVESGHIVIFDLVKRKVHRQFSTSAVSSMVWHHQGEILYAGTS